LSVSILTTEAAAGHEDDPIGRRTLVANALAGLEARFVAERLASGAAETIVYVTRDAQRSTALAALVRFFAAQIEVLTLPAWDCLPYDRVSPNATVVAERLATLHSLAQRPAGTARLVLVSANAFVQRLPPPEAVRASHLFLKASAKVDREALIGHLERNGYNRVGTVAEPGDYAVRGGLIDLFPTGAEAPVRLDFFGATLESIRRFDPLTQRTTDRLKTIELGPVSEVMLDQATAERFRAGYLRQFGTVTEDPLLESVAAGRHYPGMEHWLPLFHDKLVTIFEYLEGKVEVAFDHLALDTVTARQAAIGEQYEIRTGSAALTGAFGSLPYRALPPDTLYLDEESVRALLSPRTTWLFSIFAPPPVAPSGIAELRDLEGRPGRDFARERADRQINLFEAIAAHLNALKAAGQSPIITVHGQGAADRLAQVLVDHALEPPLRIERMAERVDGAVHLAILPLETGVTAPGLCLIGEQDLLGERLTRRQARRAKAADKFIQDVGTLSEGDPVVHAEHGIGRFEGLVTLELGGAPHDCLKLLYASGDKLFVPVENLDILTRYGNADTEVQLDKLGGVGWQNRKARIKQRIKELADELIKVAAARETRKGEALELAPGLYDEFAARFPFEETEDQLRAIQAVLDDLASGRPMDRLICGDVGFGKTEVALRAAFVAAMSGKQVAILAPTTLLARQHFKNFGERFQGLPLRVEQISRFVPTRQANDVKKGLADGSVDIVIGTHALLGKTVGFKNLGLVVVDEEQHFGVTHKERLKQLRSEVHVLTMTATPIPRTLHMALGGMKELSIIATPPVDRLAVRSFVMPVDPVVLREAILREYHRGGQTFYVCPRIKDQPRLKAELEKLVPEIKVAIANGQMPAKDLEAVMSDFYDRKLDVLLATNIVESGLDIPTANTLIVHRADLFGLSQLYQLKGRVGRSKVRGYAYFTVPANKVLQDTAEKRLHVIQSLEGLGAGFQLASHDLDIRGAGNLLGDEQSGHIKEVGFELYNHMLQEAVASLRAAGNGEAEAGEWTPQITIDAAALMPESYIADLDLRLAMYRRLAGLEEPQDIEDFAAELIDRFGPLPPETEHLLQIVAIKQLCRRANVQKLDVGPKGVVLAFRDNRFAEPARLIQQIAQSKGQMRVRPDHKLVVMQDTKSPTDRLKAARKVVDDLARLAA
jgi:transcription-repair coupling factor (superfamily II helicase)